MAENKDLLPAHTVLADVENSQPIAIVPINASNSSNDANMLKGVKAKLWDCLRSQYSVCYFGHVRTTIQRSFPPESPEVSSWYDSVSDPGCEMSHRWYHRYCMMTQNMNSHAIKCVNSHAQFVFRCSVHSGSPSPVET
jgi:hypothetical protein